MLSAAMASVLFAQSETEFSYSTKAKSVKQTLQELSQITNEKYSADNKTNILPLVISANNITPTAMRNAIAKATAATWVKNNDVWNLTRTAANTSQLQNTAISQRAEILKFQIAEAIKSLNSTNWSEESIKKMIEAESSFRNDLIAQLSANMPKGENMMANIHSTDSGSQSAANIILSDFLQGIDPNYLAKLEPGRRAVLSSSPNQNQIGLGMDLSASIAKYLKIRQDVKNLSSQFSTPNNMKFTGGLEIGNSTITPIARILIAVQAMPSGESTNIVLKLVDSKNKIIGTASQSLSGTPPKENLSTVENKPLQIEPRDQAFLELIKSAVPNASSNQNSRSMSMFTGDMELTIDTSDVTNLAKPQEAILPFVINPGQNEPLASFPSTILIEFAKSQNQNLVATLNDEILGILAQKVTPLALDSQSVNKAILEKYNFQIDNNTLILSPKNQLDSEANQISRIELTTIIRSVSSRGYARLADHLALLRLTNRPQTPNDLLPLIVGFTSLECKNKLTSIYFSDYASNRFAASLPNQHFESLLGLFQTPVFSLSPNSKAWLNRAILESENGPMVIGKGTAVSIMSSNSQIEEPVNPADVTDSFPTGIPGNAEIKIESNKKDAVLASIGKTNGKFLTATALGTAQSIGRNAPEFQNLTNFDQFRLATRMGYNVGLLITKDIIELGQYSDFELNQNSSYLNYDQLPQEFREAAEKAASNSQSMGIGQRKSTPPPTQ